MSSIEELQQRVSQAEQRFGLINEQRAKYSERLVSLIDAIESRLRDQQTEIERQMAELAAQSEELETCRNASAENQALRGMLHSLLQAIEAGGRDVLTETMQAMDAKISGLIAENVTPVAALGHAEPAVPQAAPDPAPVPELEAPAPAEAEAAPEDMTGPQPEELESAPADFDPQDGIAEEPQTPEEPQGAAGDAFELTDGDAVEPAAGGAIESMDGEVLPDADGEAKPESGVADDPALLQELAPLDETTPEPDHTPVAKDEADLSAIPAEPEVPAGETPPQAQAEDQMPDLAEAEAAEAPAVLADEPEDASAEPLNMASPSLEADFGDSFDDKGEAASLEDIMRRVSRLVEEEGTAGQGSGASARTGSGGSQPEAQQPASSGPNKAASNG